MGAGVGLAGGLAGVGEQAYQDRIRQHQVELGAVEDFKKQLLEAGNDPNKPGELRGIAHAALAQLNTAIAKNPANPGKELQKIQQWLQSTGDSFTEHARQQHESQYSANLPQPMALPGPPSGGQAPMTGPVPAMPPELQSHMALPPRPLEPPPETVGEGVLGTTYSPMHVAGMAARAKAMQTSEELETYKRLGIRPPASMAYPGMLRISPGQPIAGEDIGKPSGTWWHPVQDITTGIVFDYVQTGQPSYVASEERSPFFKFYRAQKLASPEKSDEDIIRDFYAARVVPTTTTSAVEEAPGVVRKTTTTKAPAGKKLAAPPTGTAKPSGAKSAAQPIVPRGLTGQQLQQAQTGIATIDQALAIMDKIKPGLGRLSDTSRAIHIQAALSAGREAQHGGLIKGTYAAALTRTLDPEDKTLLGNWMSGLEHVQRMRGVLQGTAGFRSAEAFETLLGQLGNPAVDPAATKETFENTYKTLQAVREEMKASVGRSLPAPPATEAKQLDEETARAILGEAGGDKARARQIAKSRGYKF